MTVIFTQAAGGRALLANSALNSLANGTYANAGTIDMHSTSPLELVIELEATPGSSLVAPPMCGVCPGQLRWHAF